LAGAELARVRHEAGLTQSQLAEALGRTQALVSMAERGLDADEVRAAIKRSRARVAI
jgi:transcriptional regulator with XRE-family HTH domain